MLDRSVKISESVVTVIELSSARDTNLIEDEEASPSSG